MYSDLPSVVWDCNEMAKYCSKAYLDSLNDKHWDSINSHRFRALMIGYFGDWVDSFREALNGSAFRTA